MSLSSLLARSTTSYSSLVVNHLDLNYKFDVNETRIIDGAKAGNETRYINHGSGGRDNCVAMSQFVLRRML